MQKSKTPRRTRPEPTRTQPDRAWKGAPRPRDGARNAAAPEGNAAAPEGNAAAQESNGAGRAPDGQGARSSAFGTLNDAYRLVDEYLRQGQQMAENIWLPFAGNGVPGWPTPGAPERFLRAIGDMTLAWVEAMQGFASGSAASAQQPNGTAGPFQTVSDAVSQASSPAPTPAPSPAPSSGPAPTPAPPGRRELGVSVEAKGRVEVSAALTELGDPGELEVSDLLPARGKAAPIRKVSVRADRARVAVRVVVPDAQPRGRYNGLLLDAKTREPRGTLSVVVR